MGKLDKPTAISVFNEIETDWWFELRQTSNGLMLDPFTPEAVVFQTINEYWQSYGTLPDSTACRTAVYARPDIPQDPKHRAVQYVDACTFRQPSADSVRFFIDALRRSYTATKIQQVAFQAVEAVKSSDPKGILESTLDELNRLSNVTSGRKERYGTPLTGTELLSGVITGEFLPQFIPYPFPSFNTAFGGMRRGELLVWSGKGSAGKSHVLHNIGMHAAFNGYKVLFVELEMTREAVATRMVSRLSGIPISQIEQRQLTAEQFGALMQIKEEMNKQFTYLEKANNMMFLDKVSGGDVERIRRAMRDRDFHPDLIPIDYMTLLEPSTRNFRGTDEHAKLQVIVAETRELLQETNASGQTPMHLKANGDLQYKVVQERADQVIRLSEHPTFPVGAPQRDVGQWHGIPGVVVAEGTRNRTGVYKAKRYLGAEWSTSNVYDLPNFDEATYAGPGSGT